MQWLIWMLCSITLLYSSNIKTDIFSEKLIVSSTKKENLSQENLLKLKVYFSENPRTRDLQEIYNLQFAIEKLGSYSVTTIKPIESLSLRNELLILLTPIFKDIFFIDSTPKIQKVVKENFTQVNQKVHVAKTAIEKKENSLIDEIGLQWVALLLLSIIGLVLSLLSRRKIAKLDETQRDLKVEQKKIEIEIRNLGAQDA
jgi:hypothetical protein